MAKYNRPNGKLFGSSATNIGVFGSGQQNETPTTSTDPNTINTLGTHWEDGWNGAVVSQAPYTAPYVEDMNAVNYVNSYNSAYLLQRGIAEYSATEEYQKDSLCTYNSEIWMCKLDNTVGQTPAEGTYWHLQGEVPIMNDKEILVGAVGGTPTVVDTNGQGDIVASATGLNIKSGVIVNADVKSDAGIDESKLALDYSTSALEGTISGHISDFGNPHNVTKAQVLSGDPIVNTDVDAAAAIEESKLDLDYATDTLNTNIGNVANDLSTHTGDTNNPHDTEISNLHDVTISTLQDGDVISYDLLNDTWKNGQPAGGALSTLSDTTITSPTDKQLVQYDYANSKWINSSDVWNTIEINDIANINTASSAVTLTASDKRHQIFTATDGFDVTLPSTGIKAGETFIFDFQVSSFGAFPTTSMVFYVGSTILCYAHTTYFRYIFTSLVDNPTAITDWFFRYEPQNQPEALSNEAFPYWCTTHNKLWNTTGGAGTYTNTSNDLFTLPSGYYELTLRTTVVGGTWSGTGMDWFFGALDGDTGNFFVGFDSKGMAWSAIKGFQTTSGNTVKGVNAINTGSMNMTGAFKITKRQKNTKGFIQVVTAGNDYVDVRVNHYYKLIAPLTVDNVT